jgi:hypothetical protein
MCNFGWFGEIIKICLPKYCCFCILYSSSAPSSFIHSKYFHTFLTVSQTFRNWQISTHLSSYLIRVGLLMPLNTHAQTHHKDTPVYTQCRWCRPLYLCWSLYHEIHAGFIVQCLYWVVLKFIWSRYCSGFSVWLNNPKVCIPDCGLP